VTGQAPVGCARASALGIGSHALMLPMPLALPDFAVAHEAQACAVLLLQTVLRSQAAVHVELISNLGVQNVALPVESRQMSSDSVREQGFSDGLVSWMASNLVPDISTNAAKGQLTWAFDIDGATEMYDSYRATCSWDLLAAPPDGVTVNVLRAGNSDRWDKAMLAKLDAALDEAAARSKQVCASSW
jgi:hypothetical protein